MKKTDLRDQRRKATFREIGRQIIRSDRERRKYGLTVDTTGSIARALERAYQQGRRDEHEGSTRKEASTGTEADEAIEWILIPPRPRGAFWTICLWMLGREPWPEGRRPTGSLKLIQVAPAKATRWLLNITFPDSPAKEFQETFGENTIRPLVRLGLLRPCSEDLNALDLTKKGRTTWVTHLREDENFYP
jgi:hypothetical protein